MNRLSRYDDDCLLMILTFSPHLIYYYTIPAKYRNKNLEKSATP